MMSSNNTQLQKKLYFPYFFNKLSINNFKSNNLNNPVSDYGSFSIELASNC